VASTKVAPTRQLSTKVGERQKPKSKKDNCRKKLAKVVRKRQKWSERDKSGPKTTKVRVKFIAILVASENLPFANAPGDLSHTILTGPVFFIGLSVGQAEVSCSS